VAATDADKSAYLAKRVSMKDPESVLLQVRVPRPSPL
jgi:hypothetical protein